MSKIAVGISIEPELWEEFKELAWKRRSNVSKEARKLIRKEVKSLG